MRLRNGVAVCAVSVLATVFSVQQGQHGPLVVYKLQVPKTPTTEVPRPPAAAPAPQQPRLRSGITRIPTRPATRSAAAPVVPAPVVPAPAGGPLSGRAPRSLGTVVMPASALPPPQVTPLPVAVPTAVPVPAAPVVPTTETVAAPPPAPLQARVLGTVSLSDIEALDDYDPAPLAAVPLIPSSQDVFHIVEDSGFGSALINEETGDSLTLQDVNDAALWRRETAERLREVPIAPRF